MILAPRGRAITFAGVVAIGVLTLGYVGVFGYFGIAAMGGGTVIGVLLGIGCVILAAFGVWSVVAEIVFGTRATRLTDRLASEEGLPTDKLRRSASGRPDREAARGVIGQYRQDAESPDAGWREMLRLAIVADASGDRRAARRASIAAIRAARSVDR